MFGRACLTIRTVLFFFFALFLSCSEETSTAEKNSTADLTPAPAPQQISHRYKLILHDTTLLISDIQVDILVPPEHKADLLILPGWNYSRKKPWGADDVTKAFLENGYRLIIPEMGKSVYATHYFPETRKDWMKYPTLTWVTDTMIPFLQAEYAILDDEKKNLIAGISTGGRGVTLIAAKMPVFIAGAALSGDYDQSQLPKDNLMRGVYGEYEKFRERWETVDNPSQQVHRMKMPLYLGHGGKDKIVPVSQTRNYFEKLRNTHPETEVVLHIDEDSGHDGKYWYSELKRVVEFFDGIIEKQKDR